MAQESPGHLFTSTKLSGSYTLIALAMRSHKSPFCLAGVPFIRDVEEHATPIAKICLNVFALKIFKALFLIIRLE